MNRNPKRKRRGKRSTNKNNSDSGQSCATPETVDKVYRKGEDVVKRRNAKKTNNLCACVVCLPLIVINFGVVVTHFDFYLSRHGERAVVNAIRLQQSVSV